MIERLYVVTREDLPPGQQAVQSIHAVVAWTSTWPDLSRAWELGSNTLALLSVPDEHDLYRLLSRARRKGLRHVEFREPDRGFEITAIVLEPGEESSRLCARLPTALEGRDPAGARPVEVVDSGADMG